MMKAYFIGGAESYLQRQWYSSTEPKVGTVNAHKGQNVDGELVTQYCVGSSGTSHYQTNRNYGKEFSPARLERIHLNENQDKHS